MTLIIERNQDADFAFASIAIILCCFVSFGLIFLPKILCIIRGRDQPLSTNGNKNRSTTNSNVTQLGSNPNQQLSSEDEEKHRKLVAENEQLKMLIAEREARVNELIDKLKQRGSNIVIRDVQRFSGSTTPAQVLTNHDTEQTINIDGSAYVMRRRSTFTNPITLSTQLANSTLLNSISTKTTEGSLEPNNENQKKRLEGASYRESVC